MNLNSVRRTLAAAAAAVLCGTIALSAGPASANVLVQVPPGCGSYSGTWVPRVQLDDHSGDASPLGSLVGAPHIINGGFGLIVVGTRFSDHIQGSGVADIICGLRGNDWIHSGSGNDEIFGGLDVDSLWGEAGDDTLYGAEGDDWMWGDNPANSNGTNDGPDTFYGGADDDTMFGGQGRSNGDGDDFHGGSDGFDTADGETGDDDCENIDDIVWC
ncbi:calcium-binding protein [Asanoa iriomotensis]|uniref:Hemolysin type calcium-binding protein n=1 Tax=Asanoa iriomotensis TaxID=234613 RepID=A0ABQ4C267_9ACTN|nr:calcium-binding protein [Asanoa iriomotensis]GIF56380.1 hypothetical protein Air01nite_24750 [Asanoa iriomotensis]